MDSIEGIKVECDEDGFHLILEGDFVDTFERYLANDSDGSIEVRLPQDVALKLANIETVQIREWLAEGLSAAAEWERERPREDDGGYEPTDPKHRDFHSLFAGEADALRKREREQRADWINPPGKRIYRIPTVEE